VDLVLVGQPQLNLQHLELLGQQANRQLAALQVQNISLTV